MSTRSADDLVAALGAESASTVELPADGLTELPVVQSVRTSGLLSPQRLETSPPRLVYGGRVGASSEHDKPKFIFIDPENPPPGVDLSELPPGVDINELMTDAYIKSGELALMQEQQAGDAESVEMTEEEWQEAQALTAELAQMAIDDYLFDTSDPD